MTIANAYEEFSDCDGKSLLKILPDIAQEEVLLPQKIIENEGSDEVFIEEKANENPIKIVNPAIENENNALAKSLNTRNKSKWTYSDWYFLVNSSTLTICQKILVGKNLPKINDLYREFKGQNTSKSWQCACCSEPKEEHLIINVEINDSKGNSLLKLSPSMRVINDKRVSEYLSAACAHPGVDNRWLMQNNHLVLTGVEDRNSVIRKESDGLFLVSSKLKECQRLPYKAEFNIQTKADLLKQFDISLGWVYNTCNACGGILRRHYVVTEIFEDKEGRNYLD
jgi:hypothetical protein